MADLLTKALLNADVDAKVTTNGANENTGARVNACLNNIVDTLYGRGGVHKGPYVAGLKLEYLDTVTRENQLWQWDGGTTTSTNWATDSTNFGIAIAANLTAVAAVLPRRYKWIGDGGAATGTVVANTLGVTINVTNPTTGRYVFTAASGTPFTAGKTTMIVQNMSGGGVVRITDFGLTSTTVCTSYFVDITENAADPTAYQVIIEVEP